MTTPRELLEKALNEDKFSKREGRIDLAESQSTVSAVCHRLRSFVVFLFRLHCQHFLPLLCVLLPEVVCKMLILHQRPKGVREPT